jgi:capsular exopolysaccharide synthesis family protein
MSRLYDTLRRMESEKRQQGSGALDPAKPGEVVSDFVPVPVEVREGRIAKVTVAETSRVIALTGPQSLGAEKFRALAARLENLRKTAELKSLQITSSVVNEGKSLVAANLAITLVQHFGYKVLLVEGDLHRPSLAALLGLTEPEGIKQWWTRGQEDKEIFEYVYKLDAVPLAFLSAGPPFEQPSQILQSSRFAEAFVRLAADFDWVVVDSTPMSPIVDVNLWSRLVDGTVLVVREGVAPIKALKMGINGLDNPKWLGMILNEASEFDRVNYSDQYYGVKQKHSKA